MTEFQCAQFVNTRYPDRMTFWPEAQQKTAQRAIERLLETQPDKVVIAEESFCIDNTNPIWPDDWTRDDLTHALLYRVMLGDKPSA